MREKFIPHDYQKYCIERVISSKAIGLFVDMGLGKTAITLFAIKALKYERWCVNKVLVIAPKKVAESTWDREASKWEGLSCLRFAFVLGTVKQRTAALEKSADIYVVNRENVQWLVNYYRNAWPFDMVVLDESSSFKNHQAKRFKALKATRGKINRIVELTGTPASQGLIDLWAQIFLLDSGKRLGRTISAYRDVYFVPDKRNRTTIFSYAPKPGAEEVIFRAIGDICVSLKSEDYLKLPELIYNTVPVKLDARAAKAYRKLEREMLLPVDEEVITAGTAAVLRGKLLQLCNGAVYNENEEVSEIHDCKIDALLETIEQLNGQHVIVCYRFRHDKARILEALAKVKARVAVYEGAEQEKAWNSGQIDILLVQPMSCGYGLNLQNGGHNIIWFGLTDSLEQFTQMNKRLHRQGQKHPVVIHLLAVLGGVDEDIIESLSGKKAVENRLLEALKARIRAVKAD